MHPGFSCILGPTFPILAAAIEPRCDENTVAHVTALVLSWRLTACALWGWASGATAIVVVSSRRLDTSGENLQNMRPVSCDALSSFSTRESCLSCLWLSRGARSRLVRQLNLYAKNKSVTVCQWPKTCQLPAAVQLVQLAT
ncbi:hypothetical protein IF1G_10011 [Cordyceps javanica]|uniref:Uncharacterized protein n=1 Tax=Cordyceps javanica TaxID=43265 RepID=A0A545UPW1_9HYPO|nr:hypothetical protein IF1G_10011 [Cordyceps javanica]